MDERKTRLKNTVHIMIFPYQRINELKDGARSSPVFGGRGRTRWPKRTILVLIHHLVCFVATETLYILIRVFARGKRGNGGLGDGGIRRIAQL